MCMHSHAYSTVRSCSLTPRPSYTCPGQAEGSEQRVWAVQELGQRELGELVEPVSAWQEWASAGQVWEEGWARPG
jgi:hypothetical protein